MTIKLRPGTPADAETCGQIIFDAFSAISSQHNFPSDFPAHEVGIGVASMLCLTLAFTVLWLRMMGLWWAAISWTSAAP